MRIRQDARAKSASAFIIMTMVVRRESAGQMEHLIVIRTAGFRLECHSVAIEAVRMTVHAFFTMMGVAATAVILGHMGIRTA